MQLKDKDHESLFYLNYVFDDYEFDDNYWLADDDYWLADDDYWLAEDDWVADDNYWVADTFVFICSHTVYNYYKSAQNPPPQVKTRQKYLKFPYYVIT